MHPRGWVSTTMLKEDKTWEKAHTLKLYLHKTLESANDSIVTEITQSGCLEVGREGGSIRMGGQREEIKKAHEEPFWVTGTFIISTEVTVLQMWAYAQRCQTIHFKYVQFIMCQLHLNKEVLNNRSTYAHTPVRAHFKQDQLFIAGLWENQDVQSLQKSSIGVTAMLDQKPSHLYSAWGTELVQSSVADSPC